MTASLRDVYRLLGNGAGIGAGSAEGEGRGRWVADNTGGEAGSSHWVPDEQFVADLERYAPGTVYNRGEGGGEAGGGPGTRQGIDGSRLPQTKYGDVSRTAAVDTGTRMHDASLVYDDPLYGKITPLTNIKSSNEWLGPTLMAVTSLGMGALMAPAVAGSALSAGRTGLAAVNAARSAGSGDWLGAATGLVGAVPGISPALASGIRAGVAGARGDYGGALTGALGAAGVGGPIASGAGTAVNLAAALRRSRGRG